MNYEFTMLHYLCNQNLTITFAFSNSAITFNSELGYHDHHVSLLFLFITTKMSAVLIMLASIPVILAMQHWVCSKNFNREHQSH